MGRAVDEVGNRYGKLVVVARGEKSRQGATWRCLCDCGNTSTVLGGHLRSGGTFSCGCEGVCKVTHGMRSHPAYNSYHRARQRCNNPSSVNYDSYGGRGIQFKFASFEQFWEELGPTWKEGLTIDRKDNNGHYEPGNCRWATSLEQSGNRRNSIKIFKGGQHISLRKVAEAVGISYDASWYLYRKHGSNFNDWPTLRS
jgi:hypothetical protein